MAKLGFFKRLGLALNQTKFEKYLADFMAGEDVFAISCSEDAVKFSAVFACLRVLSETFASVSVSEYKKLSNGDREQTDNTGLYQVLHDKPNNFMSPYNFQEASMYQLNAGGNAVSIRQKNYAGGIAGLMPIECNRIKIQPTENKSSIEYIIDNKDVYARDDVFHVPGPSMNGILGMSVLEYAAAAINVGQAYEKFSQNYYKNGIMPSGVFEHPTHIKEERREEFKKAIKEEYTGFQKLGSPLFLEDGLKYTPTTIKLADAEFIASKKFQIEDICRFFRVPLHLVQSLDRATFNNIEQLSLEFVMYTMLPHFKRFEGCINNQLLSTQQRKQGFYFEYNITSLVRGDLKSRYEAYGAGRQWGFLSVNDIRRLENMPKIPNGDIYMQPVNMIEAGKEPIDNNVIQNTPISDEIKDEIKKILGG